MATAWMIEREICGSLGGPVSSQHTEDRISNSAESRKSRSPRVISVDRITSWLTLAANVAVLIGLVFVGIEISQNTEMMRTQINQSRAAQAMSEAQSIYNSEYVPSLLAKIEAGEALSRQDSIRYEFLFRSFNRNFDNQRRQYMEGFLGENIPRSLSAAVLAAVGASDFSRTLWERTRTTYSDEYVQFVDSVLGTVE